MKFEEVDPKEFQSFHAAGRGRQSYPLLKTFIESGLTIGRLDPEGQKINRQSMFQSLASYCRRNNLPVKVMQRSGSIYCVRTDLDDEGNVIGGSNITDLLSGSTEEEEPEEDLQEITPEVIRRQMEGG